MSDVAIWEHISKVATHDLETEGGATVPTIKIDLQEGFSGEKLVILLNGREIYRGTPKTRMQIGLADSCSLDLPPQHLTLEVTTPDTGRSETLELDLEQDLFVAVILLPDGTIYLRPSQEAFGYL